ncbi:MAG TPA: hypothetical protein VNE82_03285 [Candidatus Binataceae bacterium]|nr:hypothetical protein [Candidatus Binataceae bacterium]
MGALLAFGPLGCEACRATVANFFARQSPVRFIQVRLIKSERTQVGVREWRPKEDEDLGAIADWIAGYIAERQSTDTTIFIRHTD